MATDHFKKHFYQKDRVDWNFNVLFTGQPAVENMVQAYAKLLKHPGLYPPIPAEWLHATILRVGLVDDYTEAEMLAVAEKLQTSLAKLNLPEFAFDSWWLWGGNVTLHISPDDQFTEIYEQVIAALESVVGSDRTARSPHGHFIPHVTLVYAKTYNQERIIHDRLVAQAVKPATFRVKQLSLIKQWPTAGHYQWEVVKELPIGNEL